ncbi:MULTISPECIES: hypothetical protein [unclassified Pseudomonas]|uniref:hypothetical protein n=1 Tax=unclassified Pseudomonas TaxID=196821 RepID=UPI00244BEB6A|nr:MULTISPECIES: hypothetical protein [unclassified Pseudomonas]MDH0301504.1 hypothetical protein [Pseudomonas sp. GD04091]MDH1985398.1 hypothetical protein [Pseudomonas sp. GD03689]
MKMIALIALLATTGAAQAGHHQAPDDFSAHGRVAESSFTGPWTAVGAGEPALVAVSTYLLRLQCPEGTKKIGDDCVPANIDFE